MSVTRTETVDIQSQQLHVNKLALRRHREVDFNQLACMESRRAVNSCYYKLRSNCIPVTSMIVAGRIQFQLVHCLDMEHRPVRL